MTETKKRDWGWLGYVGATLFGAAVAVIIMLSCGKKDTPEEGTLITQRMPNGYVEFWVKSLKGIAKKLEFKPVKPDTEFILDTVLFPQVVTRYWGIGTVLFNPKPIPSSIQYVDSLGKPHETQYITTIEMYGASRITQDSTGVHIQETVIDLRPKVKRTVLSVGISGGAQYGQVDTLWRFDPRLETYFQYSPWDFLKLRIGLGYPWGAFATATWEIPVAKEK